jgi:hypothetical protein
MNFLTDNFLTNLIFGSNKTHEELNTFVNKKFTFFLNNSNLLLNSVSDFEDYKTTKTINPRSNCDECEDLFILTNDIFEKYLNKVTIPFDINIADNTNNEDPNSKTNYKNKILYFFDLKDLKKILNAENLANSSSDLAVFNKKRVLCKIISLSFIKIYIIVKSIYQTFNIYDSLITKKNDYDPSKQQEQFRPDPLRPDVPDPLSPDVPDPLRPDIPDPLRPDAPQLGPAPLRPDAPQLGPAPLRPDALRPDAPQLGPDALRPGVPQLGPDAQQLGPDAPQLGPYVPQLGPDAPEPNTELKPDAPEPNTEPKPTQTGGNILQDLFKSFTGKTKEPSTEPATEPATESATATATAPTNPLEENTKLKTSKNVFYSIFVILFDSSGNELFTTNFNLKFLLNAVSNMENDKLSRKIPKIMKYICEAKIDSEKFMGETSLLFRDDNFKFMKMETSSGAQDEASIFIEQLEKENESLNRIIVKKKALFQSTLKKESLNLLLNYCTKVDSLQFASDKLFTKIKENLKIMIKNYFKSRAELYENIVKQIFVFDYKSHEITSLSSKLTYALIIELSKKAKIILLDLHITVFTSLNKILTDIANEININPPINNTIEDKGIEQKSLEQKQEPQPDFVGGGTRKNRRRLKKNKTFIKRKKNKNKNKNKNTNKK